ncbi:hypothetical protein [Bacillus sp. UNCCL81]|uniref:hypothetical protein n=1 Tax=Bacillus sp. UNCCL81 TaxID=1502755 RepID=UPI0008DF6B80|nr:hypothetical protein [Bacillus sp. UNCCL81]SFD51544.1 hypothetical protein SAMN02799633_04042 [Bacillus sp. UNCCL81]
MGLAGRLRPRRLAEEARSRPMESEHPVVEINITLLLLRKFGKLIDKEVFQQCEMTLVNTKVIFFNIEKITSKIT